MQELRRHQEECLVAIDKLENSRALIKMFCGAGKSLIIYNTLLKHGSNLSVVVVPSINLITQFNTDYLIKYAEHSENEYKTLTVCSKDEIGAKGVEFTTDPDDILEFLESDDNEQKIVLITYQSLETLFTIIEENEMTIDLVCFDEAHHVTAEGTQELLFGSPTDEYSDERYGFIDNNITKSLFFTATPINKNGICMFNLDNHITIGDIDYEFQDTLEANECSSEEPHCGDMIYEYKHIDGVNDNVLNDFDIRVDLSTQEGDISIFEAIARTILETGNSRVLTFHSRSEVASEKGSSVIAFYNEDNKKLFKKTFDKVLQAEFPHKADFYKKITLTGITASTKNRTNILGIFDKTPDDEIYLLGSCETIGEGVDTKNANMCVFVDPKQSYVKIIQNIGRICRKQVIKRNGTVLIPARVDVEKYKGCGGDPVARDKVIREEMSKSGDFNGILNCLSALRQEDPYMFELCLKYPDVYTKKELRDNFRKNGMVLDETEYSGEELFHSMGVVGYNPKVSEKANFNMLSRKLGTNIQVTNQKILEEDLYIDKGCEKTTHFVKTEDDKYMRVMEDKKYQEKPEKRVDRPHRNAKPFVHSNPDIQVLWGFTSDLDVDKSVFGGYIEADVVVDNEEKWYGKLKASKNYMDINGKRPSVCDKDKAIKSLGQWISNQLNNYKAFKKIMVGLDIRKAWDEFITDPKYAKYFMNNKEEWYNNLETVKKYIDVNGKRPNKPLGSWITRQQKMYKNKEKIMTIPEINKAWEEFITDPKYAKNFMNNKEEWYNNLETVKRYIDVNGKRPNKPLGSWITMQQRMYKNKEKIMTIPEINKAWEEFISDEKYCEYFLNNIEKWYTILHKVIKYIDNNNTVPSQLDKDADIKSLGIWLSRQPSIYKNNEKIMKQLEIRNAWEGFITNLKYTNFFTSNIDDWYNHLSQCKEYIDIYSKRPNQRDIDDNIQVLGRWICSQVKNHKTKYGIMKQLEIRNAWETFIKSPKYSKYFTNDEEDWYDNLEAVKKYMDHNNKRPNNQLGTWISNQIKNNKNKENIMRNPEINTAWGEFINDSKYKKYFTSDEQDWYNILSEVKEYIEIHNKLPCSTDKIQKIKILARWISTQKQKYKIISGIMTNDSVRNVWKDFIKDPKYKKYFTSDEENWYNNLHGVKNYIDNNSKRPNQRDRNKDIKGLASWISNQLIKYKEKKEIMTNPEIRQAWEDFINDPKYAPYFTNEKKPAPKSTTVKPKIKTIDEPKETEVQKSQRQQSEYQELGKKMATQKSETTNQMFTTTPELWHKYHDSRDFSFKGYDKPDEIPLNKIIKYLETKKNHTLNLLDLGCGRNLIQEHFKDNKKFTVTGYDYVGYNGSKVADISSLPEEDESVKVCVYSQALMGSNWKEYLVEGYRVLEYNGEMIISEAVDRYVVVKEQLEAIGMHVIREEYAETNRWFYIYAIKQ